MIGFRLSRATLGSLSVFYGIDILEYRGCQNLRFWTALLPADLLNPPYSIWTSGPQL